MTNIESYDDLIEAVGEYLQRADLADRVPLFIALAEKRLNDVIKTMPQQVALPYIITPAAGTNILSLPSDFGALIRCTYGSRPLTFISPESIDVENTRCNAMKFTLLGNKLYLQTMSNGQDALVIYYYKQLDQLSETNESNWLLEDYPNMYLYATLLETEPFVMDDERVAVWSELLSQALQSAKTASRVSQLPQHSRITRTRS
ncbi:hypothetical protein BG58_10955 [Caballeronia jiangsuensis]|nr:hypothetical protein BG58_10955 [Caballeronia jiangsuensis]